MTDFLLKECLEIKELLHRKELLSAISYLFSGSLASESKVDSEALASPYTVFPSRILQVEGSLFSAPFTHSSVAGHTHSESSIHQNMYLPYPQSYCRSASMASWVGSYGTDMVQCAQTDMSDMVSDCSQAGFMYVQGPKIHSENEGYSMTGMQTLPPLCRPLSESGSTKKSGSNNPKKLILTLPAERIPVNDFSAIRSLFSDFDSSVSVKPMEDEKGKYTIVFKDNNTAREALLELRNDGYDIRHQFPSRPSPTNPVKFIVMASQWVQDGKALESSVVGYVVQFQPVFVNQEKPVFAKKEKVLRARIMKPTEDGESWENWGWVSRFADDRKPLLQREEL